MTTYEKKYFWVSEDGEEIKEMSEREVLGFTECDSIDQVLESKCPACQAICFTREEAEGLAASIRN